MAVKISGVLKDGAGKPVVNCAIELRAKRTSPTVVVHVVATCLTGNKGEYTIDAEPGYYDVALLREGYPPAKAGEIYVTPTDEPDTLNAFLDAPKDGDLRPEVMKRFEEMVNTVIRLSEQVTADRERAETAADDAESAATSALDSKKQTEELKNQAQKSAEAAAESEKSAANHAMTANQNAQQTAQDVNTTTSACNDAKKFAEAAKKNADATAADREATSENVKKSAENAESAAQSARDAEGFAGKAEQARDEIDAALSATLKTANHLSEIAAEGEEAQQESRDNLGLKSASTMEPQSDIYDRTEGCLAIPGSFGFGALFKYGEGIKFSAENGPTEFLQWVRETPPGRYLVSQFGGSKKNPIINSPGTLVFSGYLDIEIRTDTSPENQQKETKQVIFKGINGESYTARIHSGIIPTTLPDSWEKKLLKVDDFTRVLYSWTDSDYNLPDIGGLILAAYTGDSDSENKKTLIRGRSYSGSRLRQATFYADFRSSGFESIPTALVGGADLSGTYISLSSTDAVNVYTRAVVGLFMRIA
ncbi:MAG: putative tail fiber protein [Proteobacteria bacterium]|nr:putative tail fiber protein [Pseudomonadota bacterium]